MGASGANDIDCAVCGNGIKELGEQCDGAFVATNLSTCATGVADCNAIVAANPSMFPDGASCWMAGYAGSAGSCSAVCSFIELSPSGSTHDGCCPRAAGATGANDIDCAVCGNGALDLGELCDPAIPSGTGHCPTALECRGLTTNACTPVASAGSNCQQQCLTQAPITACGASEAGCASGVRPDRLPPTNCGGAAQPACCGASGFPPCCDGSDGCCPAACTDGIDADCYCGDGSFGHGEACEDAAPNHNNYDACTDSCTPVVTGATGIPCAGPMMDTSSGASCQFVAGVDQRLCFQESQNPRYPGGYCAVGDTAGDCGAANPCPSSATTCVQDLTPSGCVSVAADPACGTGTHPACCTGTAQNGYACLSTCTGDLDCRYNEGYHCVTIADSARTPFCASPPCRVCANVCGDGTIDAPSGEVCDNGAAQNNAGSPDNYSAGVPGCSTDLATCSVAGNQPCCDCSTSCTARRHWVGDPCRVGMEATDCSQIVAGGQTAQCLTWSFQASTGDDPKFGTRYPSSANGYCTTPCSLTSQDCPSFGTLRGVCVSAQGVTPPNGVCVLGCQHTSDCRTKEGYRCLPTGSGPFQSESPRACINPGDSGPCGAAAQRCCDGTRCGNGLACTAGICN
jgi:hypothetical protein